MQPPTPLAFLLPTFQNLLTHALWQAEWQALWQTQAEWQAL
jgi:hypothetical protein